MTKNFDHYIELFKQIRKDMPKPTRKIKSGKDKMREADLRKGRKEWKHNDE
jgi:hypothetical protein